MANLMKTVIVAAICIISFAYADQFSPEWQSRLIQDLLKNYHKVIAPTHEGPIAVHQGFAMRYLDFIDEANELAIVYAMISRSWTDPRLRWDPEAYNGTKKLIMDTRDIWIPDIELYDSRYTAKTVGHSNAYVDYEGDVSYFPTYNFEVICQLDFEYFPNDEQHCVLKFLSWMYNGVQINLTASLDMSTYRNPKDFRMQEQTVTRHVVKYGCCPEPYIDVTYIFSLKRASGAYVPQLIVPSVLTGFLVLATFLLPTASYEKITLCGILFLCLLVLFTYLHDILPSASHETIIGRYLAFALFVDFMATVMAVVSYNVNARLSPMQTKSQTMMDTETDNNDLKMEMPKSRKKKWVRYLDPVCFGLFTIMFIIGLAIIFGRRE